MENPCWLSSIIFFVFVATCYRSCDASDQERRQVYIVYMGALPKGKYYSPSSHHSNMLREVVNSSFVKKSLVRSYSRSFNGFAAYLTDKERENFASFDGVVSVFPSRMLQPQTTRSWDFMGFPETSPRNPTIESNIIVGVIDTGIWPESESFNDQGIGPVPKKWKGACKGGKNFTCNNKIIAARLYSPEITKDASVRDLQGHGTHTASIAAGNRVKCTSFLGVARGTARGAVPSARVAAYKSCHPNKGCAEADVLAAFDDAIADGVDIISISIGGDDVRELTSDSIAIGSFHAMEKGLITINSAGNRFELGSIGSTAPWMISVAASSTDRLIIDKVVLGNGGTFIGNAVNSFHSDGREFPLISGKDGINSTECDEIGGRACLPGCLDRNLVKGKIVVCGYSSSASEAIRVGAAGIVAPDDDTKDVSMVSPLPAAFVNTNDLKSIYAHLNSTRTPRATILTSETTFNNDAPAVASFSSRGPNTVIPDILKPDLTAPGVDILAAYSPVASPSHEPLDKRSVKYNILSGTSMACPHAAGAAAYLKSLHPDWSPSAIKSALMTTAWQMNATKDPDAEFAYGAGHIDPVKAANPGLVYETSRDDYIKMLCNMSYDISTIRMIFGGNISCPVGMEVTPKDLNHPSMAYKVDSTKSSFAVKFSRTVTNVGQPNSTYTATVTQSSQIKVTVNPRTLHFKALDEKKSFVVTVTGKIPTPPTVSPELEAEVSLVSASLVWSDSFYTVRSPIVIYNTSIF